MRTAGKAIALGVGLMVAASAVGAERCGDFLGMELQSDLEGVSVYKVEPGGQAAERGIQAGDRIVELNGEQVSETWDLMSRIDGLGPRLRLKIQRGQEADRITLRRADPPGKLVFRSDRSGPGELWRMNADGSDLRKLTNHGLDPQGAMWSPDGKRIAFQWWTPYLDIWVMDEDGGNLRRLTSFADADTLPRWSPDGRYVYYLSYQWGGTAIARVDVKTLEAQKVVQISDQAGCAPWRFPVYDLSPDGEKLAFPLQTPQGWRLQFANPDGSNVRPAGFEGEQIAIDWSPDGHRLLWAVGPAYRYFDFGKEGVFDFRVPSGGWATFAPDSWSVVCDASARPEEKRDVYVADLTGKTLNRLTYHPANDVQADWWAPRD